MRRPVAMLFGLALLGATAGCRTCHRQEAELRAREGEAAHLKEELERTELYNQALQQELQALRGHIAPGAGGAAGAGYAVRSLSLGRATGGHPSDRCPGDDALDVFATPLDPEGQAIKAPGILAVEALEISKEGLKRPLSAWEIPPEQLRKSWRAGGLISKGGYNLTLPWKVWPSTDKLRVVATLRLTDGRVFQADKDVTVHVTPVDRRPPHPGEKPDPFPDAPILPPPRPANPVGSGPALETTWNAPRGEPTETTTPVWHRVDPATPPDAELLQPVPRQPR